MRDVNDGARAAGEVQVPPMFPQVLMHSMFSARNRIRAATIRKLACACQNSYPSELDRQGEHTPMANRLLGIFLCLILSACSTPPKMPNTDEQTVRQGSGQVEKLCTEKPPPGYTSGMEARLKAELPLAGTTEAQAEGVLRNYFDQHPRGTDRGADLDNYLFHICQMANNGGWSAGETERFIKLFMDDGTTSNSGEIADLITGGGSYAYIVPVVLNQTSGSLLLTLIHKGKYPLYDLSVRIVDLAKFEKLGKQSYSWSDMQRDEVQLPIGNVAPDSASTLKNLQMGGESLRWNLFFSARNGFFTELLRVQRVGNEWKTALKVTRRTLPSSEQQTLFEKNDPDYPLSKDGQVEW